MATASRFTKTATAQAAAPQPKAQRTQHAQRTSKFAEDAKFTEHKVELDETERSAFKDAFAKAAVELPSEKRVFLSLIAGLATYGSTIYFAMPLIELTVTAVATLTGSAFLTFIIWFIGCMLALIAGLRIGAATAKFVLGYQPGDFAGMGTTIKDAAQRRVDAVRGLFSPELAPAR